VNSVSSDRVREIATALLDEAQAGTTRATVTELARRAGITRPTLYRNHPDAVTDLLTNAAQQRETPARQRRPTQHLFERMAKLRQENEELRLHVALYEEHIRRLTIQNNRLGRTLPQSSNVARLDDRRQRDGQR
jgi:AcrR family transcriptional regulator